MYKPEMLADMMTKELDARVRLALARHKSWESQVTLYGGKPEDVVAMMRLQGCNCAICGIGLENVRKWEIDHDHNAPVKPRGLLCQPCNGWLGNYEQMALAAVKYLTELPYEQI